MLPDVVLDKVVGTPVGKLRLMLKSTSQRHPALKAYSADNLVVGTFYQPHSRQELNEPISYL
jgi:hypothetical protein